LKLKKIVDEEKFDISKDALELIASAAEGSFRDAESLLEQLSSLTEKISIESVEQTLGRVGFLKTANLGELLIKKDLKGSLAYLYEINESGYNLVQFNKDLIHYLRRVLSLKLNPQLENMFKKEITDSELETIKKHSKIAEDQHLIKLIKSFIEAYTEMRYSPFTIVPLEVAVAECLR